MNTIPTILSERWQSHAMENLQHLRKFSNKPLDHPDHQFRMLKILPRSTESLIFCKLLTIDLDTNPDIYHALSYLWGTPTPTYTIHIDDEEFFIRENLWHFLQLGQSRFLHQPIFIDANCIDQVNIPERNRQVHLMGDIYLHSIRVLSWLGQGDAILDTALPFMENIAMTPPADLRLSYTDDMD